MKLHQAPNGCNIRVCETCRVPPGAPQVVQGTVLWFCHLDGMYSLCKDSEGNYCHIAAWTEVELVDSAA